MPSLDQVVASVTTESVSVLEKFENGLSEGPHSLSFTEALLASFTAHQTWGENHVNTHLSSPHYHSFFKNLKEFDDTSAVRVTYTDKGDKLQHALFVGDKETTSVLVNNSHNIADYLKNKNSLAVLRGIEQHFGSKLLHTSLHSSEEVDFFNNNKQVLAEENDDFPFMPQFYDVGSFWKVWLDRFNYAHQEDITNSFPDSRAFVTTKETLKRGASYATLGVVLPLVTVGGALGFLEANSAPDITPIDVSGIFQVDPRSSGQAYCEDEEGGVFIPGVRFNPLTGTIETTGEGSCDTSGNDPDTSGNGPDTSNSNSNNDTKKTTVLPPPKQLIVGVDPEWSPDIIRALPHLFLSLEDRTNFLAIEKAVEDNFFFTFSETERVAQGYTPQDISRFSTSSVGAVIGGEVGFVIAYSAQQPFSLGIELPSHLTLTEITSAHSVSGDYINSLTLLGDSGAISSDGKYGVNDLRGTYFIESTELSNYELSQPHITRLSHESGFLINPNPNRKNRHVVHARLTLEVSDNIIYRDNNTVNIEALYNASHNERARHTVSTSTGIVPVDPSAISRVEERITGKSNCQLILGRPINQPGFTDCSPYRTSLPTPVPVSTPVPPLTVILPTPTPVVTPTPSPTPVVTPTPSPTPFVTPTPVVTPIPSPTPTPTPYTIQGVPTAVPPSYIPSDPAVPPCNGVQRYHKMLERLFKISGN